MFTFKIPFFSVRARHNASHFDGVYEARNLHEQMRFHSFQNLFKFQVRFGSPLNNFVPLIWDDRELAPNKCRQVSKYAFPGNTPFNQMLGCGLLHEVVNDQCITLSHDRSTA